MLRLAPAERRLGLAGHPTNCSADRRRVVHHLADILRAQILAIAGGYDDAEDHDHPQYNPRFKRVEGRLSFAAVGLLIQPTISRLEKVQTSRALMGMIGVMVDFYCASYSPLPASATVTLDIDETIDVIEDSQQWLV